MADNLVFRLIGQDGLSPVLITAGRNAGQLDDRIRAAATGSNAAITRFTRDASGRLHDTRGRFLTTAQAARLLGDDVGDGAGRAGAAVRRFTMDANGRLRDVNGRFVSTAALVRLLGEDMQRTGDDARRMGDDVTAGTTQAGNATNNFVRGADGRLRDIHGRFVRVGDGARRMGDDIRDGGTRGTPGIGLLTRLMGAARGAAPALLGVARTAGTMGAGVGAAVPLVAALAGTLVNIAPAAGLAATAMITMITAQATIKLGMQGIADTMKVAFDPEKAEEFNKALAKLAPTAQATVLKIRELKPEFDKLQQSVQNRLFAEFDTTLDRLASATMPTLRSSLGQAADHLNLMGRQVANTAIGLSESGALGRALSGANAGLRNLSRLPSTVVQGLVQIGAAAAPAFNRLTAAGGDAIGRLSDRMAEAFESGAMEDAIEHAIDLIGQLVDVGGNVAEIIGNIFGAAESSGGGTLGVLQDITAELAKITGSDEVQAGLKAVFDVMATAGKTIAPLLGKALSALGPVFEKLGPPAETLITALGDALGPILDELGPVLEAAAGAVGALVEAASPLLPVVGELAAALLPAVTPLLSALSEVFVAAAPVVQQVADTLSVSLAPILATLPGLVEPLAQILSQGLVAIMPSLLDLLVELTPSLVSLSESFAQILIEATPLLVILADLSAKGLAGLTRGLGPVIELTGKLAAVFADKLAHQVTTVVGPALKGLAALMEGDVSRGLGLLKDAAVNAVKNFVATIVLLPAKAAAALASLAPKLAARGREAGTRLVGVIRDKVGSAVGWLRGMAGRAGSALGGLAGTLGGRARDAGNRLVNVVRDKVGSAVGWIRGLPGRARSALGNLGSKLYGAGRALIQGFINGIRSMAGSAKSAAKSVLNGVRNLFPSSPAKEGPFSGKGWTLFSGRSLIEGLADGVASRRGAAVDAVRSVAEAAAAAMPEPPLLGIDTAALAGKSAAAAARAGTTINLNVSGAIDPVATAQQIRKTLLGLERTYGGMNLGLG